MSFGKTSLASAVTFLFLAAFLTSCASGPRFAKGVEPERALPAGALAYVRLDRAVLSELLVAYVGAQAAQAARPMTERTDSVVAAILPGTDNGGLPALVAVASGRYPSGAASFKLGTDASWKREGQAWKQEWGDLRVAFAGSHELLLGTTDLGDMADAVSDPGVNPIPDRWLAAWKTDVAFYLPDPLAALATSLPLAPDAIPLGAMSLSADRAKSGYATTLRFEFADERTARVYAPLCRLFLYATANALWPQRARAVLESAVWSYEGNRVRASGLSLSAAELAAFASSAGR